MTIMIPGIADGVLVFTGAMIPGIIPPGIMIPGTMTPGIIAVGITILTGIILIEAIIRDTGVDSTADIMEADIPIITLKRKTFPIITGVGWGRHMDLAEADPTRVMFRVQLLPAGGLSVDQALQQALPNRLI